MTGICSGIEGRTDVVSGLWQLSIRRRNGHELDTTGHAQDAWRAEGEMSGLWELTKYHGWE